LIYSVFLSFFLFLFPGSCTIRDLHSFPTRRSSDLRCSTSRARAQGRRDRPRPGEYGARGRFACAFGQAGADSLQPAIGGRASCLDRKSTRLNSSHLVISYAVFCLKKKKETPDVQDN